MKRQRVRKTFKGLLGALLVLILIAGGSFAAYTKITHTTVVLSPSVTYQNTSTKSAATTLTWPSTGQAAVGIVGYGTLDSFGTQKPAATASVAKLITAMMVLEKKPLKVGQTGPVLTIGPTDLALYHSYVAQGGSVVPVNSGEQLSEYDALVALLLPSANNIADSLVLWAFGSHEAYAAYANNWLKIHGFSQTTVGTDASGLSETSTSTARDLVGIGTLAHQNPVIAKIASLESANIPVAGTVKNVNWLLGVDGITGLKTGNSDAAGGAFVFSANVTLSGSRTVTLIGAVMQAPNLSAALTSSRALVQSATKAIAYTPAVTANTVVGQYNLPRPKVTSTAVVKNSVSAVYWKGELLDKPKVALRSITAPKSSGTNVGTISFGSDPSQTSPVILSDNLPQASWWYRLWH